MSDSASAPPPTCWQKWRPFLLKHFLPLGLVGGLLIGLVIPGFGKGLAYPTVGSWGLVQSLCMFLIFIISGLTLKTDDIKAAIRAWKATLYGVIAILFITPLLALVPNQLPFLSKEFQVGFLLFCTMPTTINSGVALAQSAKGSFALALLLTVLSNLIGIFTVPFFLSLLLTSVPGVASIDAAPLLAKLMLMIFLPLLIGKALRERSAPVLDFVKKYKVYLSNGSNLCLITIVNMSVSKSQSKIVSLNIGAIVGLAFTGLVIHAIFLAFNYLVATHALKLRLDLKKSVVVMCSQKTLPMAMTIVALFPDCLPDSCPVGEKGLISIPCILSHLVQIFTDAFICSKWAEYSDEIDKALTPAVRVQPASDDVAAQDQSAGGGGAAGVVPAVIDVPSSHNMEKI